MQAINDETNTGGTPPSHDPYEDFYLSPDLGTQSSWADSDVTTDVRPSTPDLQAGVAAARRYGINGAPVEDKYEAIVVTPEGSIIDMVNVGRRRKPETDPDWEECEAERKATKSRRLLEE